MRTDAVKTTVERVAKRRAALRAQGLRPKTFWLPDASSDAFLQQAARSRDWLWARAPAEAQDVAWVESVADDLLTDLDRREEERSRQQGS